MQQYSLPDNIVPTGAFDSNWIFIVTTIPILIYIIIKGIEKQPLLWLSRVTYSTKYAAGSFRNRSLGSKGGHVLLLFISFMGLATFAYFCEISFSFLLWNLTGLLLWLVNLGIISFSLGLRYILLSFTGNITGTSLAFEEYGFNLAQFYKFIAIPLLIINFFVPYFEIIPDIVLIIIGFTLIANIYILRIFRIFSIFLRRGFPLLYIILYLCALEFTPILVFLKYLGGAV